MLQRAASNAYSWWWASHIRTKQSKWLEQNLQDMEEKVATTIKILDEEGDSFAKRAEMYYKKRPELIQFVEEAYRAYRSLAERYDHLSTELQNANNTIASCFPDQVPFMEDDDDDGSPTPPRKMPEGFKAIIPKVPKPPQSPLKDLKSVIKTATRKFNTKRTATPAATPKVKSGLSKQEARQEIDKLQKQILALQTVKEFVKSSYDSCLARYWETEEQIKELQDKVSSLEDEIGEVIVIEDDEARHLMAEAALKSCQEALAQLQMKQEKSVDETRIESKRVKEAREKLESLMDEFNYDQSNQREPRAKRNVKEIKDLDEDVDRMSHQTQELQLLHAKIKEHFEAGTSLSVTEMAEKIDELVNKVISLETSVSSQTALVKRLRTETDELQSHIRTLEGDKAGLIDDKTNLNNKLREMEDKLHGVQDLNHIVEDQNTNLLTHFTEACCNLDHLSEKVQDVKPDEKVEIKDLSQTEKRSTGEAESEYGFEGQDALNKDHGIKLLNDEHRATGLVEGEVNSNKGLQVTFVEGDLKSNKELQVTGLVEGDEKLDKELQVTGSVESSAKLDNELKITTSLEKEEASPVKSKSPKELKGQEEILIPANSDEQAKEAVSNTAGNQNVSQPQATSEGDNFSESSGNQKENSAIQISSEMENTLKVDSQQHVTAQEDEPDWRQLFMNGMEEREKVLLTEYTNTLRSYKDVKKQLTEVEKKNQDSRFDTSLKLKELKTENALKNEEIKLLRHKLSLLQISLEGNEELEEMTVSVPPREKEGIEAMLKIHQPDTISPTEEKFRANIDEILEENLDFWLKFSATFTEIQKFESTITDLQSEVSKLEEKGKALEGSSSIKYTAKSDARPIYKHLVEIQTELTVWLEKSVLLKDELQHRFSSLCDIQEEITKALKTSAEDDDFQFTSYQAAKFQGEVLNMKHENNKVADELQAGLDHVTNLQLEVEKALAKLTEQFGLSSSRRQQSGQLRHSESRSRVPLRSFIFGVKPKKQKQSIFSCMTPGMHRKYRALRD